MFYCLGSPVNLRPDDDDVDEEERETGSPARVVGRKSKVKAKLPRDMCLGTNA